MTAALLAMSCTPLFDNVDPGPEAASAVHVALDRARSFVHDYDPDLIVNFAPDHYNGFFHELVPPFCIGFEAVSIGDYGSQAGPLDVPTTTVIDLANYVLDAGLDTAVSPRMEVDHGAVQPMELMYGDITAKPIVPIFINSVAPPFSPIRRIRSLGRAVGGFFARSDKKVLFIASGGLSHDSPIPRVAAAGQRGSPLGRRGHLTREARDARQQRVITAARDCAAGQAFIQDPTPEWDLTLLDILASGDLTPLDTWTTSWMNKKAGNSSHEIRTWIAAYSALGATGPYKVDYTFYRPIREYIAGFGVTTATLV